ncbi:SWIB domain-containing protein [Chloropicon primus]|uniref:SWIB domain-containing protein n=1 Tax=Chloropicon primus TaxID=1764295 RepID=A0A5B8MI98_9CHLO|nr:SWIB domain-containing protein [Chloropicon primus]UPQ99566.1 SWIB domain-containing protein [Chloropicon primus]|mmetsp:Transcript_8386/g.23975  ORF Transcript_8386/g.23975 Transcript_8386/m.23975 type:complete len:334 (-) Transcript_8386:145-1146(-)|eukprot:QDZ20358.1 SWIB domain-containing protein [Chloropicon primus]
MMLDAAGSGKEGEEVKDDKDLPSSETERILDRLREILKASDLEKTTGKSLRRQLESELGKDLSAYKPLIKEEIRKYLEGEKVRQSQESQLLQVNLTQEDPAAKQPQQQQQKGTKGGYGSLLSPQLSEFLGGPTEMARTQVVKKLWEYIKGNNLQNASDKRKIDLDDNLSKLFKAPLTMFNMNKQLSRHCKTDDRAKTKESKPKTPKKLKTAGKKSGVKKTKAKAKKAGGKSSKQPKAEGEKKRGGGGFGNVHVLEPLASFLGTTETQRTEIVKKVWDYIKANNCKDPNDGRNIIPDETLGKFLTAPVNMFSMQKQLSAYLQKIPKAPKVESKS